MSQMRIRSRLVWTQVQGKRIHRRPRRWVPLDNRSPTVYVPVLRLCARRADQGRAVGSTAGPTGAAIYRPWCDGTSTGMVVRGCPPPAYVPAPVVVALSSPAVAVRIAPDAGSKREAAPVNAGTAGPGYGSDLGSSACSWKPAFLRCVVQPYRQGHRRRTAAVRPKGSRAQRTCTSTTNHH